MSGRAMLPQALRFSIFRRDNFICRYCGRSSPAVVLNVEHVIPVVAGGTDEPTNLVTACADCNSGKGVTRDVTPPEAAESQAIGLAGLFAHELDDEGYASRQMRIVREVAPGRWLVTLFSWMTGEANGTEVIDGEALLSSRYALYADNDQMLDAYERRLRHPEWLVVQSLTAD